MFIIYDLIFLLFTLISLPAYLARRKFHRGFSARLGRLPANPELHNPIWIHAVSVGEAIAIKGMLEGLRKEFPAKKFVISTVTPTGNRIAQGLAQEGDLVTYLPLDFSFIVRRVISGVKPSLFIIAETEIWPNLISCLYKRKIPVIFVNCRISDKSFRSYRLIKFLIRGVLNKASLFLSQSPGDTQRLLQLGVSRDKVVTSGNMKFDAGHLELKFNAAGLELGDKEQLLVCGSTHPQEEEVILEAYKKLIRQMPNLRLLLAPRHPQRAGEVEGAIVRQGFDSVKVSQLASFPVSQLSRQTGRPQGRGLASDGQSHKPANRLTIFILDTVGQLVSFYAIADIVFVGGSLIRKGGHNILEPASLAKPVIFGPYMFNFRDIADLFLRNNAAVLVRNQAELEEKIGYLLNNPDAASGIGEKARKLVLENRGATHRNIELIKGIYAGLP